jgi:hypothetical protein
VDVTGAAQRLPHLVDVTTEDRLTEVRVETEQLGAPGTRLSVFGRSLCPKVVDRDLERLAGQGCDPSRSAGESLQSRIASPSRSSASATDLVAVNADVNLVCITAFDEAESGPSVPSANRRRPLCARPAR